MNHNRKSEGQLNSSDSETWSPAQLSQALRDLARGEQTANALENNLSKLESKLDELLASFEEDSMEEVAKQQNGAGASDAADKKAGQGRQDDSKDPEKTTTET